MRRVSGNGDTGEDNIGISLGTCSSQLDKFTFGHYVVCKYDIDRWIGKIKELSFENEDALISFMHPRIPSKNFHWPVREEQTDTYLAINTLLIYICIYSGSYII